MPAARAYFHSVKYSVLWIKQPTCARSIGKGRAVLRSVTRMIRRWGNPRFVQSIRDVACRGRRESGAGVERKGVFHRSRSFSSPEILVISRLRLVRVRGVLCCHLLGGAGSLFRGRESISSARARLQSEGRRFLQFNQISSSQLMALEKTAAVWNDRIGTEQNHCAILIRKPSVRSAIRSSSPLSSAVVGRSCHPLADREHTHIQGSLSAFRRRLRHRLHQY
jgi:hypothetical protein